MLEPLKQKKPLRKSEFKTTSGIEFSDLAVPSEDFSYMDDLGFPGEFPYTRGCLLYTSPSPRDATLSRMPSSA